MDLETTFVDETVASDAVGHNLKEYTRYSTNEYLPSVVDGLKLLWRRLLITVHAETGLTKCAAVVGQCTRLYHPHGDSGVEDGLKSLGQPFKQIHPWIIIKGNYGAYSSPRAAAGRYLDVCESPFTKDIFFDGVDMRTLTYTPGEYGGGILEPKFLIPKLPTSFLFGGLSLACGYQTNTPFYNFDDVCEMTEKFIELRHKCPDYLTKYDKIAKYCLPDFPSHSLLRNPGELLMNYAKGNFDVGVVMDGEIEVEPNCLRIRSIPYGTKTIAKVVEELGRKLLVASFVSQTASDVLDLSVGTEYSDITIRLKRGINPFAVLEQYKKDCYFTQTWTPNWIYVDPDGYVCEMNPMQLLEVWYQARRRSVMAKLKFVSNDLFRQYRKLTALIIIADHGDEVVDIIKQAENRAAAIPVLAKRFKFTREQAEYIVQLQLHQLTHQGKADLLAELEKVKQQIAEHQKNFGRIDELITEDIAKLRKDYAAECPRRTLLPSFMGVVEVADLNGFVRYNSIPELIKLLIRWGKNNTVAIHPRPERMQLFAFNYNVEPNCDYPKEFYASRIQWRYYNSDQVAVLRSGRIFLTNRIAEDDQRKATFAYVGKEFSVIRKGFKFDVVSSTELPFRQQSDAQGQRTDIVYFNGINTKEALVAFADAGEKNIVTIRRMKVGDHQPESYISKNFVLGIWRIGDPVFLTIPEECVTRSPSRQLFLMDPVTFMGKETVKTINFNQRKVSDGTTLGYLHKSVPILSDYTYKGKLHD